MAKLKIVASHHSTFENSKKFIGLYVALVCYVSSLTVRTINTQLSDENKQLIFSHQIHNLPLLRHVYCFIVLLNSHPQSPKQESLGYIIGQLPQVFAFP